MGEQQRKQYEFLYGTLYNHVIDGLKSHDKQRMKESQRLL